MSISDLLSSSFLFSIAIIVILIGGIFAFVSYRMTEQDHKLTSMVNLVSILAQDLQMVKNKIVLVDNSNIEYSSQMMGGREQPELISVSDDNDDDDDEDTIDNDIDDEDDTIPPSEYDSSEDETEEYDTELLDSQEQIKVLNLTLANEDIENDSPIENLNCDFYTELKAEDEHNQDIKTICLETSIAFEDSENIPILESNSEIMDVNILNHNIVFMPNDNCSLKNISITDLGDDEDLNASKTEYKKMSLTKLREVAVIKGVVADASKLKKNEILKMLGDE